MSSGDTRVGARIQWTMRQWQLRKVLSGLMSLDAAAAETPSPALEHYCLWPPAAAPKSLIANIVCLLTASVKSKDGCKLQRRCSHRSKSEQNLQLTNVDTGGEENATKVCVVEWWPD